MLLHDPMDSSLGSGSRRFTGIKRGIDGISQRMLTVALRRLERDRILTRTVYEVMPPNVTYQPTSLGKSLLLATTPLVEWSTQHLPQIDAARARYDQRTRRQSVSHTVVSGEAAS